MYEGVRPHYEGFQSFALARHDKKRKEIERAERVKSDQPTRRGGRLEHGQAPAPPPPPRPLACPRRSEAPPVVRPQRDVACE